jgi:endonuclease YncB( thermonuclease family)
MATGLLRVSGTIDLGQFWPTGGADADTTKILLNVGPGAFSFRSSPGQPFQATNTFRNAYVTGRGGRHDVIDNKGRLTVRLQGIDASELHYRPRSHIFDSQGRTAEQKRLFLDVNEEYRQFYAETATVKLFRFLNGAGQDPLPCTVDTAVDYPEEVFDIYGRFIGDIFVRIGQRTHDVNQWLVERGLAFPSFYNSMSEDEILALWTAADRAYAGERYLWPHLADSVGRLDWDLRYRRPSQNPTFVEAEDVGDVVLPKLFRRLSTWETNQYAGMVTTGFWSYLESRRDECYLTDEFLNEPTAAPLHGLHEFVSPIDGFVRVWPEQLVFREATCRLRRPGGGDVTTW